MVRRSRKRFVIPAVERDRLVMFSDGVFAIVVTLLVLEIGTGDGAAWHDFQAAIPELGLFAWSFFLVARFWQLHVRLFGALKDKIPGDFMDINSVLLFFVALLPFATKFFGDHFHQSVAFAVYAAVIGMIGLVQARIRSLIITQIKDDDSEEAQAVHDALPFVVIPIIMAISIPAAFLSPTIGYILWGGAILVNIVRGVITNKKEV